MADRIVASAHPAGCASGSGTCETWPSQQAPPGKRGGEMRYPACKYWVVDLFYNSPCAYTLGRFLDAARTKRDALHVFREWQRKYKAAGGVPVLGVLELQPGTDWPSSDAVREGADIKTIFFDPQLECYFSRPHDRLVEGRTFTPLTCLFGDGGE